MMKRYIDLIRHTFYFDTEDFVVMNNELYFHGVRLMPLIQEYGTPLRLTYLPKIGGNIQKAKTFFKNSIEKHHYEGTYTYCYCTKSSHFSFVLEEVLKNGAQLETSSAYDIRIIEKLYEKGLIDKSIYILNNGFKRPEYSQGILNLIDSGFSNCTPILDHTSELNVYENKANEPIRLGMRLATDEEPGLDFYTSRLGIRLNELIPFYRQRIEGNRNFSLKVLHFFNNSGIKDTVYFWTELSLFIEKYCELKKICPDLDTLDIGGGFPIKNSLSFAFDYQYMTDEIINVIQSACKKHHVPAPNIFTEFGSFTVGESGAMIYSVLGQKQQNDKELWYMLDGSFITQLPDTWGMDSKFIMLPINNLDKGYRQVLLGGITCDSMDYYNSESHAAKLALPQITEGEKMYLGFFNMGAYQESLGGFGGTQHCLVPGARHVLIRKDNSGNVQTELFSEEQSAESMLKTLGY